MGTDLHDIFSLVHCKVFDAWATKMVPKTRSSFTLELQLCWEKPVARCQMNDNLQLAQIYNSAKNPAGVLGTWARMSFNVGFNLIQSLDRFPANCVKSIKFFRKLSEMTSSFGTRFAYWSPCLGCLGSRSRTLLPGRVRKANIPLAKNDNRNIRIYIHIVYMFARINIYNIYIDAKYQWKHHSTKNMNIIRSGRFLSMS